MKRVGLSTVVAALVAAACGGGETTATTSGSTTSTPITVTTTTAATTTVAVTGTWFDGLAAGVCFDDVFLPDGSYDFSVPAAVVPCDGLHDNEVVARVSSAKGRSLPTTSPQQLPIFAPTSTRTSLRCPSKIPRCPPSP